MSSGVVVIDNSEHITIFNKMAGEITGFKPEEAQGKHYSEIFGSPKIPEYSLINTLKTEKTVYKQEKTVPANNGEIKPIVFSTTVIFDEKEELLGAVEIFEDLTEIKRLQEEVRRNQTLVELGEMAANIAHEIRNPLGGIGGFATLLERDLEGEPKKQILVQRIIEGINDLNKITSDALVYTRKMEPDFRSVNIKSTVQDAISLVALEAEEGGVEIDYHHPKEDIEATIDANLIKRMILNLMKNAVMAMPAGGTLTVNLSWKLLHNQFTLSVKDMGVGIDEANLGKIFNPFFTTNTRGGTGLGLAIVRKVVEVHNGKIRVNSEVGVGTEFIVNLPILRAENSSNASK